MSVYLKDDKVLLDSSKVVTSEDCCCTPKGACCDTDGTCTIETEDACDGAYQGDDSLCEPNPCTVCSDSVSLCKCGFTEFSPSTPPKHYLTETFNVTGHCVCTSGDTEDVTQTIVHTVTVDEVGICTSDFTCDGDYSASRTGLHYGVIKVPGACSFCGDLGCCFTGNPDSNCSPSWCLGCTDDGMLSSTHSGVTCDFTNAPPPSPPAHTTGNATFELSDEYTTSMLITKTLALLGDCPMGCSFTYIVNDDETCCTAWCIFDV